MEVRHDPTLLAGLFLVEFIPIYWIFRSLSDAHHRRLFLEVLTLRGVAPAQVIARCGIREGERHSSRLLVGQTCSFWYGVML